MLRRITTVALLITLLGTALAQTLTLYSGRGEALVQPLIERFTAETGIRVNVRYGDTAQLAVLILEEGRASPADVYWGQDAGSLGALAAAGVFRAVPTELSADLPGFYASEGGLWLATSGRARVLAYSPERTADVAWPESVFDLTDARFSGRVGWAPTNGSLQSFVTAMRVLHGDDATRTWLAGMMANGVQPYRNNTSLIEAIAAGEIDYALTNHYYLLRYLATDPAYPVSQAFFGEGDVGNLVNVAGAGILATSRNAEAAERFLAFLSATEAQSYFTEAVFEYAVSPEVPPREAMVDLERLDALSPEIDLDALEDLPGTLDLLREVGLL
jgi:iron(III) transport system substrate-binding protein